MLVVPSSSYCVSSQLFTADHPPCPESPAGHRAVEVDHDEDPSVATAASSAEDEEEEAMVETSQPHADADAEGDSTEEVAPPKKRPRAEEKVGSSSTERAAGFDSAPFIDPDTVINASPLAFCPPPPVTKKSKPVGRWNLLGLSSKNPVPVQSGE